MGRTARDPQPPHLSRRWRGLSRARLREDIPRPRDRRRAAPVDLRPLSRRRYDELVARRPHALFRSQPIPRLGTPYGRERKQVEWVMWVSVRCDCGGPGNHTKTKDEK